MQLTRVECKFFTIFSPRTHYKLHAPFRSFPQGPIFLFLCVLSALTANVSFSTFMEIIFYEISVVMVHATHTAV